MSPKKSSERRIAANRVNAQCSTGPVTPDGKAICSQNALKHGLFSRDCVLPDEDRREFNATVDALRDEYKPATNFEDQLIHEIAAHQWRLRRLLRTETGLLIHNLTSTGEYSWSISLDAPDPADPDAPPPLGTEYDEITRVYGASFWQDSGGDAHSKLIRHETNIRRALFRDLNALCSLQARRKGEAPPRAL